MTGQREDNGFPSAVQAADARRRSQLVRLPIEEKLRLLVELQRLAADIARSRRRPARNPWQLEA